MKTGGGRGGAFGHDPDELPAQEDGTAVVPVHEACRFLSRVPRTAMFL